MTSPDYGMTGRALDDQAQSIWDPNLGTYVATVRNGVTYDTSSNVRSSGTTLDALNAAGISYSLTPPTSGEWAGYTIAGGQQVYVNSPSNQRAGMGPGDGLTREQQALLDGAPLDMRRPSGLDADRPAAIGGAGGMGTSPAAGVTAGDRANRDAYARLQAVLDEYGLGSLAATVQQWLVQGLSESEIVQQMRDTNEFKTRFPAIEERRKKGLAAISPGEYVAYERQARQMMRAAGIPEGFYDGNDDFQTFLVNDLSLAELGGRVTLAANAAFKMPKEDLDALAQWGMGPGELTAFWLNPDKAQPLLERKYAAAQLAGVSTRTGWGSLNEQRATDLATMGVTAAQAEQGFGALAGSRELFQSLDRTEDTIGEDEQLAATFGGNSDVQRRFEQRRRKRQATFESGGSFASGQGGIAGLGDTSG